MGKLNIWNKSEDIQAKRHIKKLLKKKSKPFTPKIMSKKYFSSFHANNSFHQVILYYKIKLLSFLNADNKKLLFSINNELKIINMINNYIPKITNIISDFKKLSVFKYKFISLIRFLMLNDFDFTILTLYIDKILNEKKSIFTWENLFILGICSKAKTNKKYELFLKEISNNNYFYNELFHLIEPKIEEVKQRYDSLINIKNTEKKKEIDENALVSSIVEVNKTIEKNKTPIHNKINLDINFEQIVNKEENESSDQRKNSKVFTEENVDGESVFAKEIYYSPFNDELQNINFEYFFEKKGLFGNNEEDDYLLNNNFIL